MAEDMSRVGFYYDQKMCAGCKTCQVACKDRNRLDVGVVLREVRSYQVGAYPNVSMYHFSAACNHCEQPACMANCPVNAIEMMDDGTVVLNTDDCIGCQTCVTKCPYGVPRYDEASGVVRKCDGCYDLRQKGYQPACVEACPFRALDFGTQEELEARHAGVETVNQIPAMGEGETSPVTRIVVREDALEAGAVEIIL